MNITKEIFSKQIKIKFGSACLMLASSFVYAASTFAQTTEFTYQGKLSVTGTQEAAYDFEFYLCNSLAADCTVPLSSNSKPGVSVTNGLFMATLDFGEADLEGTDRFLEIRVKRPADNTFTTLAPRQKITSAPYSIKSKNTDNAARLGGTAANQFVQTGDPRLDANNYVRNTNIAQPTVNFNIGGTGAANILNAGVQFNLAGSRILSNAGANNLFAGSGAGASNTNGDSNAFFGVNTGNVNTLGFGNSFFGTSAGLKNIAGNGNSYFGNTAGVNSTAGGNSFFGYSAGTSNTTGGFNTFFGILSGSSNTTGSNNTFIGANTGLFSSTTPQVNNSTAIGSGAFVSTSNTIVLGTNLETTRIPGKTITNKLIMGGGILESGGIAQSFSNGSLSGIFTANIFFSGLNTLLASPVHLCTRSTTLGSGFGGDGLARCSTSFSSKDNKTGSGSIAREVIYFLLWLI